MDVNSLPKTVTRQRRGCDLNPGPSAPESSTVRSATDQPPPPLIRPTQVLKPFQTSGPSGDAVTRSVVDELFADDG